MTRMNMKEDMPTLQKGTIPSKDLDINFENFVEIYFADVENRLRESTIKNKRYVFDLKVTPYFKKKRIGNKDDMNAKNEDGLLAKRILTEFMDEFQARNPNLYIFSAHLHMDEETPHLHIDFVPYITGSKR